MRCSYDMFIPVCFISERAGVFKMSHPWSLCIQTFHPRRKRVHFQAFVPFFCEWKRSETVSKTHRTVIFSWFTWKFKCNRTNNDPEWTPGSRKMWIDMCWRCCYITVDSATPASQNSTSLYSVFLNRACPLTVLFFNGRKYKTIKFLNDLVLIHFLTKTILLLDPEHYNTEKSEREKLV
jgi:hypothetical protein